VLKTIVLICQLNNPTNCLLLEDTEGLHKTFNKCAARANELREALPNYLPHMRAVDFKCVKETETQI
tara:strand:+ start:2240 stop:2440 length:201 start_codon:yes stop_codon:yes gene_type:complete